MDFFSQKFSSFLFTLFPIVVAFWFATTILRRLTIKKHTQVLDKLTDDKKARIIGLYRRMISFNKIYIRIIPFGFLLFVAVFVLLIAFPELNSVFVDANIHQYVLFAGILLVVLFINVVEDLDYRRKILKAIDKSIEKETS